MQRKMITRFAITIAALTILHCTQPARAAGTWYIRPDGSDTLCNGRTEAPATNAPDCAYATIAKGISSAVAGDTVSVGAGAYTATVTVNKAITLEGGNLPDSAEAAIINGTVSVTAAGATVARLKVVPGAVAGNVAAIHVSASNVIIADNIVEGMTATGTGSNKGLYVYKGGAPAIGNITLAGNTVRNLTKTGGTLLDGIMIQGVIDGVTVTGNTIENLQYGSTARGIDITLTSSALNTPPRNVMIAQNTLRAFTGNGVVVDLTFVFSEFTFYYADASQVTVAGNSFTNTGNAVWNRDSNHTLNASANWLNSNISGTVAGRLGGSVDYTPWLNSGTDTDLAMPGFQGDFSVLWVDDVTQTGAIGRIQEGVTFVAGGTSTVNVLAGAYNEALTLNKTGLVVVSQGAVTLSGGSLTLTEGLWVLGAHNLSLASGVTVSGGSSAAMVVADGAGALCRAYSGTSAFTFPIGDHTGDTEYSPATLNFTAGIFSSGQACVRVTNALHPNNVEPSYLARFWTVTTSGISAFTAEAAFVYTDADIAGARYEAGLKTMQWNGSNWSTGNDVNAEANKATMTVNSFSDFTAGGPVDPTSVTLAAFDATPQGEAILVTWETATELENLGFNLYRGESPSGPWVKLNAEMLAAQNPGATFGASYEWQDTGATPGVTVYYRLEDVDIHGASTFHGPISATATGPSAVVVTGFAASGSVSVGLLLTLATTTALAVQRKRGRIA